MAAPASDLAVDDPARVPLDPDPRAWTADELEAFIPYLLHCGDMYGTVCAVRMLVPLDPDRAARVYDALELGLAMSRLYDAAEVARAAHG